ncbi:MAG TPA: LysE/ArgO family amino acid transporter [Burkholderiaceae bacterium]|jgi:L-lysine exporter family protein LysE/ArgO
MFENFSFASLVTGATLGASLIVAIGAQNVFVLRQGLRREHVAAVVAVCALLDIVLMTAGVGGLGAVVSRNTRLLDGAAIAGALVLLGYGLLAFRRALRPHVLRAEAAGAPQSRGRAVAQALSISLLNPHVYLDTVVLVGAIGARQAPGTQGAFLVGAGAASCLWFASLGFGARVLSPLFARALAWRVLDALVGVTMCWIAFRLAFGTFAR